MIIKHRKINREAKCICGSKMILVGQHWFCKRREKEENSQKLSSKNGCGKRFYSKNAMRSFKCGIDKSFNHNTGSKLILCPKCKKETSQ